MTIAVLELPHSFYGTATINGRDIPVNSVIIAKSNDIEVGRFTVTIAGEYGEEANKRLLVEKGNSSTITFYAQTPQMDNFIKAQQTAAWQSGAITNLSLTFSGEEILKPQGFVGPKPVLYGQVYDGKTAADGAIVTVYPQDNPADTLTDIVGPTGNVAFTGYWKINLFNFKYTNVQNGDVIVVKVTQGGNETIRNYTVNLNDGAHLININFVPLCNDAIPCYEGYINISPGWNSIALTYKPINSSTSETLGKTLSQTILNQGIQDILFEGSSKTYTINGKEYQMDVMYVGGDTTNGDKAKFSINGEITGLLAAGDSYVMQDGAVIRVQNIIQVVYTGAPSMANKVQFLVSPGGCDVIMRFDGQTQHMIEDVIWIDTTTFNLTGTEGYFIHCTNETTFIYEGVLW